MSTPIVRPINEAMLRFGKDSNGCVIVTVFDLHGEAMQAAVASVGFAPTKLLGADAIAQTNNIIIAMKQLHLERTPIVCKGATYQRYTFHPTIIAPAALTDVEANAAVMADIAAYSEAHPFVA